MSSSSGRRDVWKSRRNMNNHLVNNSSSDQNKAKEIVLSSCIIQFPVFMHTVWHVTASCKQFIFVIFIHDYKTFLGTT